MTPFMYTSSLEKMEANEEVKSPSNQQGACTVPGTSGGMAGNETLISHIN